MKFIGTPQSFLAFPGSGNKPLSDVSKDSKAKGLNDEIGSLNTLLAFLVVLNLKNAFDVLVYLVSKF